MKIYIKYINFDEWYSYLVFNQTTLDIIFERHSFRVPLL